MRHVLSVLLVATAAVWLTGCNTSEGIGKDVKAAGEAIEKTAKDTKEKM